MVYVVLEGIDGSGKDKQADLLCDHYRLMGMNPLRINEPSDLPTGKLLRQLLKSGEHQAAHPALFLADRLALMEAVVRPALLENRPVVSVRCFLSTLVYQQEDWPLDWLIALHRELQAKPDILIVLDLPPEIAQARAEVRAEVRKGHMEVYEKLEIQTRNRARYRALIEGSDLKPLMAPDGKLFRGDGEGTPSEVHDRVLSYMRMWRDKITSQNR